MLKLSLDKIGEVKLVIIKINISLLELYSNCKKDVGYSLTQLLDSIPDKYSKQVIDTFEEFTLKGNSIEYKLEDYLAAKVIDKFGFENEIDKIINLLIWIAFLFPEI